MHTFEYTGKKNSGNGLLTAFIQFAIAAAVLVYLLGNFDDIDSGTMFFEILFIVIMLIASIYEISKPRSTPFNPTITIEDKEMKIENLDPIYLSDLNVHRYKKNDNFTRYHIWDDKGIISIYSVYEDNLIKLLMGSDCKKLEHIEESSSSSASGVSVFAKGKIKLYYSLYTGTFDLKAPDKEKIEITPQAFIYDPKYKKRK